MSFPALDPKTAIVYVGLVFEDYNYADDASSADADRQEAVRAFMRLGNDVCEAASKAEGMALADLERRLKTAGLDVRLTNESHDDEGGLIVKFGVSSIADVERLVRFVRGNSGGGEDEIYLDAPYMAARGFRLYPQGVNRPSFVFGGSHLAGEGDIEDWLEAQSG